MTRCAQAATLGLSLALLAAAPGYEWDLPPGFPVPYVPDDNPMSAEKVALGRRLFYDTRLSGDGTYACASCHRQERAFTDGRARAVGATGGQHRRSAPSLANVAYSATLTWADPRMRRLEDQARVPMFNEHPVELGLPAGAAGLLDRLRAGERYERLFAEAFPGEAQPLTVENLTRALASFERTLISGDSPYNRLVYAGEMDALSESARRGMRLFFSERARCSHCHAGFTFSGPVVFEPLEAPVEPAFHNIGLHDVAGDRGLAEITGAPADDGRFRAPTLYNVALTAPYMHDGSVATLEEVVELYAAGGRADGRASPNKSDRITGFEISEQEKRDLVAFLHSLTDLSFIRDPRFSDPSVVPWAP